ncbi:unnamed protein product [Mesocestoides corti]|nr:unnamed protein product [Mesocestoides corti]
MRLLENRLLGFQECFAEVTRFLGALPVMGSVDEVFRKKLLSHLHACIYRRDYEARARLASLSAMSSGCTGGTSQPSSSSDNPTTWDQSFHVKETDSVPHNVSNLQAYWQHHNLHQKSDEHPWSQVDYQRNPRPHPGANESQSTTSPSLLGNYEETDSGNSTTHRFSPSERDVSTDVQTLHSIPWYTYPQVECDRQGTVPAFHSQRVESFEYTYHQNYPESMPLGGSVQEHHAHVPQQQAVEEYTLSNCQTYY